MIPFKNLPVRQFNRDEDIQRVAASIASIKHDSGREYPLTIGDRTYTNDRKLNTSNPSDPSQTLAVFQKATRAQADEAFNLASETFESWKTTPAQERADILLRTAEILRRRRDEAVAPTLADALKSFA